MLNNCRKNLPLSPSRAGVFLVASLQHPVRKSLTGRGPRSPLDRYATLHVWKTLHRQRPKPKARHRLLLAMNVPGERGDGLAGTFRCASLLGRSQGELGEHRRRRVLERFAARNAALLGKIIWFLGGRSPFLEAAAGRVPQSGQRPRPSSWTKFSVPPIRKNWFPAGRSPFLEAGADRVPQSGQRPRTQKLGKAKRPTNSKELVSRFRPKASLSLTHPE